MSTSPDQAGHVPGQTSAARTPNHSPSRVVVELLRIAQSLDSLGGMWRLAAAGYRPEFGPSEAILFDFEFWDPAKSATK